MNLEGNRSIWAILNWLYIVSEKSYLIKGHNIHITPVFFCVVLLISCLGTAQVLPWYCSYLDSVLLMSWLGTAHILTRYYSYLDSVLLISCFGTAQVLTQYCSYLDSCTSPILTQYCPYVWQLSNDSVPEKELHRPLNLYSQCPNRGNTQQVGVYAGSLWGCALRTGSDVFRGANF